MNNTDQIMQHQQRLLQMLKQNAGFAGEQASLLSELSVRHAHEIARSQAEATRAATAAWLELIPRLAVASAAGAFSEYMKDCGQRWVLFLDTLCQRGDACIAREKEGFKPVLAFDYDMIIDGRKLDRPVNYALVRIHPPAGNDAAARGRPALGHHRSARRARQRHRRLQKQVRGRRRLTGWASGLFRHLLSRARAGPDAGGRMRGRSGVHAGGPRAPSAQPEAAGHRQLPGRLGGHDSRRHASRSDGPDRDRRRAAVLLGGRERPQSVPLFRRRRRRRRPGSARVRISAAANSTAPIWC